MPTPVTDTAPKDLIGFLDFYLVRKAPFQLPDSVSEFLVQWGPWIAIVLLIFTLPPLLFVLGIGTFFVPFLGVGYAGGWGFAVVATIVQVGLLVAALPGLFARKMASWRLIFYSQIVGIVVSLLSGSIVGALIGGLIGLYILFQIRGKYTN